MANDFLEYQRKVREAVSHYEEIREKRKWSKGNSGSVKDLAHPFLKGHYTLAIVGKMSAGKSTFINALTGQRNLLATGFGQTTSTLTEIMHGDELRYEVHFYDGKKKGYTSLDELKHHMAIQEKFVDLPIKQINALIVQGKNAEQIRERQMHLEAKCGKRINLQLLDEYVKQHNKSNIPKKVCVFTKLPAEYQGWKFVDTPGIAATGGVEDETYNFLKSKDETGRNNSVDAIIFVNSAATQIEDSTFQTFVQSTIEQLPESVRKRLFLVRTHGADRAYLRDKEQQDKEAQKLFVDALKMDNNRLIVLDSLCHLLLSYTDSENLDLTDVPVEEPEGWGAKLWQAVGDIVTDAQTAIKRERCIPQQETLVEKLSEWSNFKQLSHSLQSFAKEEKKKDFDRLVKLICDDYVTAINSLSRNIANIEKNKGDLDGLKKDHAEESKRLEELKKQMGKCLIILRDEFERKAIGERFNEIKNAVYNLSGSIDEMKLSMRKHISEVQEKAGDVFQDFVNKLNEFYKKNVTEFEVSLPNIDFDSIKNESIAGAKRSKIVGYHQKKVKEDGFTGWFKRRVSFGLWGYKDVDDKTRPIWEEQTDMDAAKEAFLHQSNTQFTIVLDDVKEKIKEQVQMIGEQVLEELKVDIASRNDRLSGLNEQCQTAQEQEDQISKLRAEKNEVEALRSDLTL